MQSFLEATEIVDWQEPGVYQLAKSLAAGSSDTNQIAMRCFEWVRDEIPHSSDYKIDTVTCSASQVLARRTGICFAKSHLLAAILRANEIPAGFCYQRLSIDDKGPPYSLHGFNAVWLPEFGWYRIDPRGNRTGIDAQFAPPREQLAYQPKLAGEMTLNEIYRRPLPVVIDSLQRCKSLSELWSNLPDLEAGQ